MTNSSIIKLNKREIQVLELMSEGKTNSQIAKEVNVSVHTVKANIAKILCKFQVKYRIQAVVKAIKEKIIEI